MEGNTPVAISRASSEGIDEVAGAFKDMLDELGVAGAGDDTSQELMPSCCFLLFLDCFFLNICNFCKSIKPTGNVFHHMLK